MKDFLHSLRFRIGAALVVAGVIGFILGIFENDEIPTWVLVLIAVSFLNSFWLLSRWLVRPIIAIREQATDLSPQTLERRLKYPNMPHELDALTSELNRLLEELEHSFQAQERFIANASHELRTPISVLLSQAQVLAANPRDNEEYRRFIVSVQDELQNLATLVNSLLILAQAEAGVAIGFKPTSINDITLDIVQRRESQAHERQVRLIPTLAMPDATHPEAIVSGDPHLLRTMLDNLLRNAIRHSPPNQPVEIVVTVDQSQAIISIEDRGPGIPQHLRESVFERFFQRPVENRPPEGIGLGLAIAKAVANLHNATIIVADRIEGGCRFTVEIPLFENQNSTG